MPGEGGKGRTEMSTTTIRSALCKQIIKEAMPTDAQNIRWRVSENSEATKCENGFDASLCGDASYTLGIDEPVMLETC